MTQCITTRFVGLDVHKDSIVIAVADAGRGVARSVAAVPFEFKALRKALDKLGPRSAVHCCYEAGPTGYGLARTLLAEGWACDVIAPSLIPKKPGERIKNDRRDAIKLAQNLRSGDLVAVFIPDEDTEAIRDLVRARDDAKKIERVARNQLGKFLLRNGSATPAPRPGMRPIRPGSPNRSSESQPDDTSWPMGWRRSSWQHSDASI
jgi:transposase